MVQDRKDGVIVYYRLTEGAISKLLENARELVADEQTYPPVPDLPVDGCPCPKCEESSKFGGKIVTQAREKG
ncbi:MAG: hypothetical protein A2Y73_08075 [Chloroflexi bacterium RBG_13_56_8]|nr:MAG: hypothetical protein A2Y73_08075 [Chloroflexi bacterium RBG_13_56_8]